MSKRASLAVCVLLLVIAGYVAFRSRDSSVSEGPSAHDVGAVDRSNSMGRPEPPVSGLSPSIPKAQKEDGRPAANSSSVSASVNSQAVIERKKSEAGESLSASQPNEPAVRPTLSEVASELRGHTWTGGGFQSPDTPGFDELFREQRRRTAFTYTDKPIVDGIYYGNFGADEKSSQLLFTISLKQSNQNDHQGFTAEWFQWQNEASIGLSDFKSLYSGSEVYFGFVHLPTRLFKGKGIDAETCPEILVIRHFDWDWEDRRSFVTFFNARVYCRKAIDDLTFLGRMGFKYLSNDQ